MADTRIGDEKLRIEVKSRAIALMEERKAMGVSYKKQAEGIGISLARFMQIKKPDSRVSLGVGLVVKFCNYYKVSADYLLGLTDEWGHKPEGVRRCKLLRQSQGMSGAELARRVGCNASSISRIENGLEPAYRIRGQKIADALGWTGNVEELWEEVN